MWGREGPYFVKEHSDSKHKYIKDDIIKPRPWGIKGETFSILPSLSPSVKSFTPSIGVYIAWYLINRKPCRWGLAASTRFLMLGFNMPEFLVDNIFMVFGEKGFKHIVGIPIGTNCAPLLTDIFLYSYDAEFIQSLLSTGKKKLASQFNFTLRYIDNIMWINIPDFDNYLGQM